MTVLKADPERLAAVVKAYDIRGIVPDQLDAETSAAVGAAFGRFADSSAVLVGRDMRPTSVELADAFSHGVRTQGVDTIDIGLASTDLVYFAAGRENLAAAMFTASHNPAGYNGIKLCLSGARPVGQDTGLDDIKAAAAAGVEVGPTQARRANARCSMRSSATSDRSSTSQR